MDIGQVSNQNKNQTVVKNIHHAIKKAFLADLQLSTHIYAGILFLASVLVTGYGVYVGNHPLQIPLVHLINDPSLYPNDPFADTLPYYASTLWQVVARMARVVPLEPLLLGLFLIERLFVIYAGGHLARVFAPKSQLAVVATMALFALGLQGPTLGGNSLVLYYFEQTGVAIAFLIMAIAAFYNSRPIWFAVWLALGFNCNSMFGVYAITYLGAVFLLDSDYRREWKKWLLAFGVFLLLASPAIWLTLSAFGRKATDNELWYLISEARFPHHLFPLTWNKIEYGKYFVLIAFVLTFLYQNRHKFSKLLKHSTIWAGMSFLWLIYAFVAAYVTKSPSMLVMHPGRGITLWYGFAAVALVSVCAVKLESTRGAERRAFLAAILSATILIWHPIIGPYILAACLFCFALRPVWYYLLGKGNPNRLALLLTVWVVLTGLSTFQGKMASTQNAVAAVVSQPDNIERETAQWIMQNTPTDAVFLIDPKWWNFRAISKRPAFVTWKDGSAILWDRSFVRPWTERLQALGLEISASGLAEGRADKQLGDLYKKLQDTEVEQLKSRYGMSYWIVRPDKQSQFPVVFQNRRHKVLRLE
jgi:hypothetical protein